MKDYVARSQATDWYFWAAKYFLVGTKKKYLQCCSVHFPNFLIWGLKRVTGGREDREQVRWIRSTREQEGVTECR